MAWKTVSSASQSLRRTRSERDAESTYQNCQAPMAMLGVGQLRDMNAAAKN